VTVLAAVTGADGFIGSHLVEALVADGARVRAMVLYNAFGSYGWLESLAPDVAANVDIVQGDVRDPRSVDQLLDGADVAYHLAALIGIPYSYEAPHSYVDTNVLGTMNLLEAARRHRTPRVVITSTSEVYGTARQVPIDEGHPLQAQSPYSASKIAADKLAESYHLSFGLPVIILRPFNTFGPRQSARAVIPTVISQVLAGAESVHLGATEPTRDFTFVDDTVGAFLAVGTAPLERVIGGELNAGTGTEIAIGTVAQRIGELMGRPVRIERKPERLRPAASEVMRLVCDSRRLRDATGWAPRVTFDEGLLRTIAWFREPDNLARYRTRSYAR
jgi:NAD dependent epimerase/dehydratase